VTKADHRSRHERWAYMRFAVVGQLLAAPPPKGELRAELKRLAAREWPHPITGLPVRFGVSTLERWLHKARKENRDPVRVLRRKVRTDVPGRRQEATRWLPRPQPRARHSLQTQST